MVDLLQEDRGLIQVHAACVAMRAIWRPTSCHDIGLDGQIEFLEIEDSTISTGKIVAAQVKSGPSYFSEQTEQYVKYYPSAKHRRYWRSLNIPILLVLHNPAANITIYADVKPQLDSDGPVLVPKENRFDQSARIAILEICDHIEDPRRILSQLRNVTLSIEIGKTITGIEFLLSCLSPSHQYFELRMGRLHTTLELGIESGMLGIGSDTYDFVHRCSLLCMGANIAESFIETFNHQWYELKLVPDIVVPLTPFGTVVANYLLKNADEYVATSVFAHHGFISALDTAMSIETLCQRESDYLDSKDTLYDYPR